jgi:glycosyltransferase involved in cell wall biosynthesis
VHDRLPRLALDMYVLAQGIKTGVYRVCDELYPLLERSSRLDARLYFRPHDAAKAVGLRERFDAPTHSAPATRPSDDADILLSPFGVAPREWTQDERVLKAHIVYDLIGIRHPEYFSAEGAAEVRRIMDSLDSRTVVFAISESTRSDLLAYRPELDARQVTVIPLAAGSRFRPCKDPGALAAMRAKYGIPPGVPYVLSLATLEIRKNLDQVVHALSLHLEQNPESNLHLVLSGMSGWKLEQLRRALGAAQRWRHRIILTGFVEDADLSALYSDALCFVYLSRYEGFGLPPLEAMACGTPVVCADNSSLPEVVGNAGLLFDADDVSGVASALQRIATSPALRQELAETGAARARLFSWQRCAEIVTQTLVAAQMRRAAPNDRSLPPQADHG